MENIDDLKSELVSHLTNKGINNVFSLWGETRAFYKESGIIMGGSYSSAGNSIRVTLNINKKIYRFIVSMVEIAKK